jgi:hypothetical protein
MTTASPLLQRDNSPSEARFASDTFALSRAKRADFSGEVEATRDFGDASSRARALRGRRNCEAVELSGSFLSDAFEGFLAR